MLPALKQSHKEFFAARIRSGLFPTQTPEGKWYMSPDPQLVKSYLAQFPVDFQKELKKYANMTRRELHDIKKIVKHIKQLDEVETRQLIARIEKQVVAFKWRKDNGKT